MQVDGAQSDFAAAGLGHPCLAKAGDQRAQHKDAATHFFGKPGRILVILGRTNAEEAQETLPQGEFGGRFFSVLVNIFRKNMYLIVFRLRNLKRF